MENWDSEGEVKAAWELWGERPRGKMGIGATDGEGACQALQQFRPKSPTLDA